LDISWSQLLEGNNQNIINYRQLEINLISVNGLGVIHVLPNSVLLELVLALPNPAPPKVCSEVCSFPWVDYNQVGIFGK